MIFLEPDLSQAESRVVFMLTMDAELRRLAKLPSWEYDSHTENIVVVGLAPTMAAALEIKQSDPKRFKQMRHVGKITSHGAMRDMRGAKLSGNILKELEVSISPEKCDQYIENYHRRYPAIRGVYFKEIRKLTMRDKALVTSRGRMIDFRWDRLDDELFRQAYSFLPQAEVADHLNQYGLKPLHRWLPPEWGRINVQVHDSLLISVQPAHAYDVAKFLEKSLARPLLLAGDRLVIPVEFKLGLNWAADEKAGEGFEFKRLPGREEFEEKARLLERRRAEWQGAHN